MRHLMVLSVAALTHAGMGHGASTLASYGGSYVCPQLMQIKPAIQQLDKAKVDVKIDGTGSHDDPRFERLHVRERGDAQRIGGGGFRVPHRWPSSASGL